MANDASKIVVGANGSINLATVGSSAPTNATSSLAAAFKALGFVSEDGVTVTPGQTVNPIMAWQSSYPVRKIVSQRSLELDFVLREFNAESVVFAFGGGTLTSPSPGTFKYVPPAPEDVDIRALVLDWEDGSRKYRLYVPNGQITDLQAFTVSRTAPAALPVKFELNSDGSGDAWTLFSNDTGLGS